MYNYIYSPQRGYCNPMADYSLAMDVKGYIEDELRDSRYYKILAGKAPTQRARELLMEFSMDEEMHAKSFMQVFHVLSGTEYIPAASEELEVPEYKEALKVRLLAETADYKKYGEKYLEVNNTNLKDLFFTTRSSEAQHAMRIPLLMEEQNE